MCDTFVALPSATADHSVIFGKNSDREANEAQSLEYHPAQTGIKEKTVQCTYITVPGSKSTYATLLCRPFWMWGAEMGANEKGVVIGNEAVFSWVKPKKTGVLTGMDIIRLALERAGTAENALETVISLISDHGQGGIGGYEDRNMAYNNSFLIADPGGAWVLEAAGHLWAAKQISESYAISNGLTIGEDFDRSHPDLIPYARKYGKLKKGEVFNFTRCYSDWFYTTFSACRQRGGRSNELLHTGKYCVQDAFRHLRDHNAGVYRPDRHFLGNRICAHAANPLSRKSMQTTGSFVAHLNKNVNTFWVTGTAAPCLSLFKPVRFQGKVLPDIGVPGPRFDPDTLWWRHEQLHRMVLRGFPERSKKVVTTLDQVENQWIIKSDQYEYENENYFESVTSPAFGEEREQTHTLIRELRSLPVQNRPLAYYTAYWMRLNRKTGIKF